MAEPCVGAASWLGVKIADDIARGIYWGCPTACAILKDRRSWSLSFYRIASFIPRAWYCLTYVLCAQIYQPQVGFERDNSARRNNVATDRQVTAAAGMASDGVRDLRRNAVRGQRVPGDRSRTCQTRGRPEELSGAGLRLSTSLEINRAHSPTYSKFRQMNRSSGAAASFPPPQSPEEPLERPSINVVK